MSNHDTLTWRKVEAGHYASADGRYAVRVDGYEPSQHVGADPTGYDGFPGGEWAAILVDGDNNLSWFTTMREAKECCEWHARHRGAK